MLRLVSALFISLIAVASVAAHDYWFVPSSFTPVVGKPFTLSLHFGDRFVSEGERSYQKKATALFKLLSANGITYLDPRESSKPIVRISPVKAGVHIITLERDAQFIKLEAKKFNSYLESEGLSAIVTDRKKNGETDTPGRERYRRYITCYLRAGDKGDDGWKKRLGHTLEIVPLSDPTELKKGDTLTIRIRFDDRPLSSVQVMAFGKDGDKVKTYTATTSAKGEASFKFVESGIHLVRLVHMQRAKDDRAADWHSWWGAVSFEVK